MREPQLPLKYTTSQQLLRRPLLLSLSSTCSLGFFTSIIPPTVCNLPLLHTPTVSTPPHVHAHYSRICQYIADVPNVHFPGLRRALLFRVAILLSKGHHKLPSVTPPLTSFSSPQVFVLFAIVLLARFPPPLSSPLCLFLPNSCSIVAVDTHTGLYATKKHTHGGPALRFSLYIHTLPTS